MKGPTKGDPEPLKVCGELQEYKNGQQRKER